ncbi:unnamed protein product [Scytosiphon promiscuus]
MLSLRTVGTLTAGRTGCQPPLPLVHPTEASVVLVEGERASEHDTFNGAINARIVTPPPGGDAAGSGNPSQSWGATSGAAAASADGGRLLATMVVGEGGKALLAQFYQKHGCLAISDVTRGLHRGFVRLRIAHARGSNKAGSGGVQCMAGSQTPGSGLVFLGRAGVSALQAVRVDPWDQLGSLSHPLGDAGRVVALACHPSRPIVAACLSDGTIGLWDYQGVGGRPGSGRYSGSGSGSGLGEGGGGGDGFMGGGAGGGAPGAGMASPTLSPPKGIRGSSKAGKDEKIPLKPRLEGRLSRIATLSTEGMPWSPNVPGVVAEGFQSVAFHPAREWLCACTGGGLVGVWNLDRVVGRRPEGGDDGESSTFEPGYATLDGVVRPFAARVIAAEGSAASPTNNGESNDSSNDGNSSGLPGAENAAFAASGIPSVSSPFNLNVRAAVTCVFLASEPVVMVAMSVGLRSAAPGLRLANEPPPSSRLVLLSLLDGTLPVLYSVVAPHAIEGLAVEPRSGRIFAARSRVSAPAATVPASGVGAVGATYAADGPVALRAGAGAGAGAAGMGGAAGAGNNNGAAASAGGFPWGKSSPLAGGEGTEGMKQATRGAGGGAAAWDAPAAEGFGGEGGDACAVSVLALASGTFLDRGPFRVLNTTMEVPPTVFLDGVMGSSELSSHGTSRSPQQQQQQQQPLIPLPLQVYFLRSMAVLIQAGPGGGVDVPAVKAVLHAQGLERDKGLKDRSKPRRLASLPGHTGDLLGHGTGEESSGFPHGHLMPYRLVAGPLLRLSGVGGGGSSGGGAAGVGSTSLEERRRFLVLYEIVAAEGSDRPPPPDRDTALLETSRTVCGLVTPAGYGEAHGRYENEAQLSHLFPATDACFVSTSTSSEPSALLIEGGGYLAAVYSIPDMQLLGRKALSLPVTRVLATPECLGSQRGKVLYVVRSPHSGSGFVETMVYSDRGGLQCPEPLVPAIPQGTQRSGSSVAAGWGGDRPYANAHLVLEPLERVVDAKFQQLTTVAELATWGYRAPNQQQQRLAQGAKSSPTFNSAQAAVPMLAVLTTRRVLMLSASRLSPVAQAWGHPPNSRSALGASGGLSVSAISVAWAGSSVVCTLEDGRVVYLNPGDGMKNTPQPDEEPDIPGGGSLVSSPWRPLCSLDRRFCAGGIGIAACLPDRLCFVVRSGAGGGIAHLVTRPFFPLEPLVAGVLAATSAGGPYVPLPPPSSSYHDSLGSGGGGDDGMKQLVDEDTLDVLRRIVARYAPPRSRLPRGTNPGDGPGLGAGATCAAFRLLSRYGLHVLAAEVAGVSSKGGKGGEGSVETRSSDVFMRRRPWIAPLERSRCAASLLLPFAAMMEGIGDDPALLDTTGDPDAMTSALLPAVGSRLSRMAMSLGEQSARLGLHEDAARLFDLSGDDTRLADYLKSRIQNRNNQAAQIAAAPADMLAAAPATNAAEVEAAAEERLRALESAKEAAGGKGFGKAAGGDAAVCGAELFRRPSLLAGVSRFPQASSGGLTGKALEAAGGGAKWDAILEEAKPAGGLTFGGAGGVEEGPPSSSLRPLALHCAEQWSGRVRPECLEVNPGQGTGGMSVFATAARQQPLFPTASMTIATPPIAAGGSPVGLHRFATASGGGLIGIPSARSADNLTGLPLTGPSAVSVSHQKDGADGAAGETALVLPTSGGVVAKEAGQGSMSAFSSLSSMPISSSSSSAAELGSTGDSMSGEGKAGMLQQPWASVGGSWRDEENVCGYWRFSEGVAVVGGLQEGEQVGIKDLTKFGSAATARGRGLKFEETSSPVDPGDKGKVAEAIDVCFPEEDSAMAIDRSGLPDGGGVKAVGDYRRGVFVRAVRGSSIDIGLFHDDQRRSVATVEMWVNAGEKPLATEENAETATAVTAQDELGIQEIAATPSLAAVDRRFRQQFHVLACRVSTSGEHVWSLVVENNGQVAFIPGPGGRRDLGPGFSRDSDSEDGRNGKAKIAALKDAVYTEAGAFAWDKWTHVAVTMDTSRDESSAEVRLFLDGVRVGLGTCRFNKVPQFCMSETWMVLGPDLMGWKLTEARVWAMLRDEDSLQARHGRAARMQDWKENSLALAETKKARLTIRAASKIKDSAPNPRLGVGSGVSGRLAPPPGSSTGSLARRRLVGTLTPPREGTTADTGLRSIPAPPGSAMKDSRKIRPGSGSGTLAAGRLRPPIPATSRDPRKAALAARQVPSEVSARATAAKQQLTGAASFAAPAPPLNFAAFSTAPGGGLSPLPVGTARTGLKDEAGLASGSAASAGNPPSWHKSSGGKLATPAPPLDFASFSTAPGGGPVPLLVGDTGLHDEGDKTIETAAAESDAAPKAATEVVGGGEAAAPTSTAAGASQASGTETVTGALELPSLTVKEASPEGVKVMLRPAPFPPGATAAADVTAPTRPPSVAASATFANAWADFGEKRDSGGGRGAAALERRFSGITVASATLATPTNSDVSSVITPSSSRSAWADDATPVPAVALPSPGTRAAVAVVGGGLFPPNPGGGEGKPTTVVREGQDVSAPCGEDGTVTEASSADSRPAGSGCVNEGATVDKKAGGAASGTIYTLPTTTTPGKADIGVGAEALASPESHRQDDSPRQDETTVDTQETPGAAKPAAEVDDTHNCQIANPEPADEQTAVPPSGIDAAAENRPTLREESNLVSKECSAEEDTRGGVDVRQTGREKENDDDPGDKRTEQPKEATAAGPEIPSFSSEEQILGVSRRDTGGDSVEAEAAVDKGGQRAGDGVGAASSVESVRSTSTSSAVIATTEMTPTATTKVTSVQHTVAHTADPPCVESKVSSSTTAAPENLDGCDGPRPSHPSVVINSMSPMSSTAAPTAAQKVDSVNRILDDEDPTLRPPKGTPEEAEKGSAESKEQQGTNTVTGASEPRGGSNDAGGIRSIVLAGPDRVFSIAEAAMAHSKSPLLGAAGTFVSMASRRGKLATVAVVDLWNEGATTRYPIGCLSAILSPRTDEQVIALLSEGGMQVFSVTQRVRRRHEPVKASDVRLWKWMADDVIAIVTQTAVLSWDVRGQSVPKNLFARHRPGSSSASIGADRACDYRATADGRWGLLSVADKEHLCDGCRSDPDGSGDCACETSLMLDLHDFGGSGATRCFRALGAALLDTPKSPSADATFVTTSATAPSRKGFSWNEPLLAAVVPDGKTGLNVLQLLRLGVEEHDGGSDDHYLCSVVLQEDGQQHTERRRFRKNLRESNLPAVPFRILTWRPEPGVDLLAVLTLAGGMMLFEIEPEATALKLVSHDGQAFPAGVVGVEEDSLHGDIVVLSAGVGEDRSWVVSRASSAVVGR